MIAIRVLALLISLFAAYSSWAAESPTWQVCSPAGSGHCRPVTPQLAQLTAPLTAFVTVVRVPPGVAGKSLAVDIDAMASAVVRWNGVVIGTNGMPGPNRSVEVPGQYSASFTVPPNLVRPGDNRVTIVLSSHHLWLPVAQPIHRLAVGPRRDADAYTLRHYLPTLATLALPACAFLIIAGLLVAGRIGRRFLPVLAVLAIVVAQGLLEVSKIAVPYAYPWHLARMVCLTVLTATVGLLLVLIANHLFLRTRVVIVLALTGTVMLAACALVSGLDRQALTVFEVAMLAAASVSLPYAARGDLRAIVASLAAVTLAIWAQIAGPDFLDTGYYIAAAAASVTLGIATIMRPDSAREMPIAVPLKEPTFTLRDGGRHHVIDLTRLVFLKADDDYCSLHLDDGREVVVTMTLKAVLAKLPPDVRRIHRSHAVNVRHLRGTRAGPNGRLAELTGGVLLPIGRVYASELKPLPDT